VNQIKSEPTTLSQFPNENPSHSDSRALKEIELYNIIEDNVNITSKQKQELYGLLKPYLRGMTSKPGEYNLFTYKF
jgi:hypothetical protein